MSISNGLQIYTVKTETSNSNHNNNNQNQNKIISPYEYNSNNNINIQSNIKLNTANNNENICNFPFCKCKDCIKKKEKDTKNKQIYLKNYENYRKNNTIMDTNDSNYSNLFQGTESKKRSNISSMDNIFKEHLGLQSVMKRDYINNTNSNIPLETNQSIIPKNILGNRGSPFIGRSTNSVMFPEFVLSPKKKNKNKENLDNDNLLKIPFSGNSSYKENYNKFEDRHYLHKISPIVKKDNLENMGKWIMETTNKARYKNIKYNYNIKGKNSFKHLYSFSNLGINPPQNKDIYLSHYKREFIYDKDNTKMNAIKSE